MRQLARLVAITCLSVSMAACAVQTYPESAQPEDPVRHFQLQVPDSLEVVSVDYDIVIWEDAKENPAGRGFVKVVARNRVTSAFVLMLFEDIAKRTEPIEVIAVSSVNTSMRPSEQR